MFMTAQTVAATHGFLECHNRSKQNGQKVMLLKDEYFCITSEIFLTCTRIITLIIPLMMMKMITLRKSQSSVIVFSFRS